jgi:TonB family protein
MRRLCFVLLISACALFAQSDGEPADARGWMDRGVGAFKNARYAEAVDAFQRSVDLDPSNLNARLYLATSFFVQYIPGAISPDNLAFADKARAGFEQVLALEPDNKTALQYLASLAYQVASGTSDPEEKARRLDAARSWYEKLAAVDPKNKEAWYSLGVIDWMKWYPKWMEALTQAGMKPDEQRPISNYNLRQDLRNTSGQLVEDGIANLAKALEIDPQHDNAMAYMNLLVRERASVDDTMEQYEKDIALANDWVQKSLDAKKAKAGESTTPAANAPSSSGVQRIRVGGNVQKCNLITKVEPVYPALAKQARIQGTVRFQMIIGADGRVQNLQLVSGHPLLVQAAQDAVQQWVYRPTLLDGQRVEVVTTVDVNFVLDGIFGDSAPCSL